MDMKAAFGFNDQEAYCWNALKDSSIGPSYADVVKDMIVQLLLSLMVAYGGYLNNWIMISGAIVGMVTIYSITRLAEIKRQKKWNKIYANMFIKVEAQFEAYRSQFSVKADIDHETSSVNTD